MKSQLLLLTILVAAFSSCTTAYKTGQTPDDVYFSPLPKQEEYVKQEREDDRRYEEEYYDDRYLRMKVRNRYQWNDLNNWYYYERWGFGHNYYWGSYYNPYNSWNYYYNPYCQQSGGVYYSNPKTTAYKPVVKPRTFNLGTYTNTGYNTNNANTNNKGIARTISTRPVYSNTNNSNNSGSRNSNPKGLGNAVRTIFSGNENNNSGNSGGRTYTPSNNNNSNSSSSGSSSSGGGSSSGGSSGGGVSRPTRN